VEDQAGIKYRAYRVSKDVCKRRYVRAWWSQSHFLGRRV